MKTQDRIDAIKNYLDNFYGYHVCDGTFVDVGTYGDHDKIVVSVNKKAQHIHERRTGRGIQAMRIVNCISKRFGGSILTDKTLVLGKDGD